MIPTRIGQRVPGGYFAGIIREEHNCYSITIAPAAYEKELPLCILLEPELGATSPSNGRENSLEMNSVRYPGVEYCASLVIDGCNDFYVPAMLELELCYRNYKPFSDVNVTYSPGLFRGVMRFSNGTNLSSIPTGQPYSKTNPTSTVVTSFQHLSKEAFKNQSYRTSTSLDYDPRFSVIQKFCDGFIDYTFKMRGTTIVRPVRREVIV